ncbi:hypothetical protein [Holospora obtusa]|uniref:hypothetical protein n=1 Tax=Holospora obtusa TaxID=49893 RepID=UPI0004029C81|nr:hypothetical protein [Holospora obtusa]
MSRFFFLLFSIFLLSSCDSVLTPKVKQCFSRVYIEEIPGYSGVLLKSVLQRMFSGSGCDRDYTLSIDMETSENALEMGKDAKIALLHTILKASFTLKHCQNIVHKGQVTACYYRTLTPSFYGQTSAQFYVSQEGAQHIAQEIFAELGRFFHAREKKLKKISKVNKFSNIF